MKLAGSPTAAAAERRARCRICAKAALPGAALCGQCRDAVKRARQVPTVMSQFMPLALSAAGTADAGIAAGRRPPAVPAAHAPRARGASATFMAIAAFGLAVCVGGYLIALHDDDVPPPRGIYTAGLAASRMGSSRVPLPPPATPEPSDGVAVSIADLPSGGPPGAPPVAKGASRRATPAQATSAGDGAPDTAASSQGDAVDTPDPAPAEAAGTPAPVAAPAAPEPAVADRWQAMNAAIAACRRETFLAGVICEQRVRLRYCEGFWGDVPQCGKRSPSDNAR